ncbi:MAG: hypothetical protein ABI823_15590 [Bryobacteraceae bacterium]
MASWKLLALLVAQAALGETWFDHLGLPPGRHPVGFRIVRQFDLSRFQPPTSAGNDRATPVTICVWYPAAPGNARPALTLGDYWGLGRAIATTSTPPAGPPPTATVQNTAKFAFGLEIDAAAADRILATPMLARRDSFPVNGKFPVVIGGLEAPHNSAAFAEYLASRGYIVITSPSLPRTGTLQASRPLIALETQTRNLEFLAGFMRGMPQADPTRLAIVAANFDGMAGLVFEMRNLAVSAVVSLDGWEGKANSVGTLRAALDFDPQRLRVPYLLFSQNEANPPPGLALDDRIFDSLRYSERAAYSIQGLNHGSYVLHLLAGAIASAEQRPGFRFVMERTADWLDAFLRRDAAAAERIKATPAAVTFTHRLEQHALDPLPTEEEVEEMVMAGGVDRLADIFRRAVRANPDAVLFTPQTLDLYAFRFEQRGNLPAAIAIVQLRTEAFPASWAGWNRLAGLQEKAGRRSDAAQSLDKAIQAIEADASLSAEAKRRQSDALSERRKSLR